MKKQRYLKKGLAILLTVAMVAGLVPTMSGGAVEVQAATENGTGSTPSVTAYATSEQLMDGTFAPNESGEATNYGKLIFGKNKNGDAQEWYILGKDSGVEGDNTIIFAASPIATEQIFYSGVEYIEYNPNWECNYSMNVTDVYPNHYGGSDLRVALQRMLKDEKGNTVDTYFSKTEQDLMNGTTVTTKDLCNKANGNNLTYTTTDKLYALMADDTGATTIKAGTNNQTILAKASYWSSGARFWLRSPDNRYKWDEMYAAPGGNDGSGNVYGTYDVRPASNLNLSSVRFASGAQAASSGAVSAGTITSDTAMTLRLDGTDTAIGTVIYDETTEKIAAQKDSNATGTVSLVVQGNDGTNDWYYSVPVGGTTVVTANQIKDKLSLGADPNLAACKIWLETTIDNVAYARTAELKTFTVQSVTDVEVAGMNAPVGGNAFDTEASCNTTGIATTAITYTTTGENGEVEATGNADWNTTYKTKVTLGTGIVNDVVYVFGDSVSVTVTVDGEAQSDSLAPNVDGTVIVTREFTTAKRKIVSVAPEVPTDSTFTTYYGYEGYNEVLSDVGNSELGKQAMVTLEGTELVASTTEAMDVTWSVANADDAPYDRTPGAENIFRWTIPASEFPDYDASVCQGYDAATDNITDAVTITNKAATPVNITGTDSSVAYTGETIDVSQYFTIDSHAGTATYSLVTGADGGTGEGTLSGTILTVTKTGTFKIRVNTAANGIYAAGEKTITLTVSNGTIEYSASDYSGTYDGQPHSISVNVTKPEGTTVTYSTDGENYGSDNPSFRDEGRYTVYYRITKDNYSTVEGAKTVTIQPLKKGDVVKDDKGTGDYKVTDAAKKEVAYQIPANKNATTISIPATVTIDGITYKVTSVADNAFANNKKITKVTIGSNITTVGKKAFYKCTKLKTVKIGKNVTSIGSNAFYGCKKLKTITIKTTKLTSSKVGSKAFKGIYAKATIKVPKSKLTSYQKILKAKGVGSEATIKK